MDKFYNRRQVKMLITIITIGPGGHQGQQGPQSLATGIDYIMAELVNQDHFRGQTLLNKLIDSLHIISHKVFDLVYVHADFRVWLVKQGAIISDEIPSHKPIRVKFAPDRTD